MKPQNNMKAYLNNPTLKSQFIERIKLHQAQDRFIKGSYARVAGDGFRGCAVGCSIESLNRLTGSTYSHSDHSCYESGFGVPRVLASLQDGLFEHLPHDEAMEWPLRFWDAIPVGADLTMVWPRFALWLLVDPAQGVLRFACGDARRDAIQSVAGLYARWIAGDKPAAAKWIDARAAAYAAADAAYAAADVAYAAVYAAAAADAAVYAYAASASAYAASSYAYASAASAAYAAAAYAARRAQAAKLIELISTAPNKIQNNETNQQNNSQEGV